ncbi:hypothetical protein HX776_17115 [Pseudomonas agarici]|uniref:dermonecrotic toxin domain-containing protein n=1 Tax=Pseudomonas agarici TaxID=46677 RepID=UPI0002E8ADD3|nr:DUF6543 domain-containing protein [Pseudomonas agarici]NWC10530.1 hypothetical protein [Pseudomonas agarici]SEL40561.1 hypothetical protein SAMN05216604_11764 [Pseudomonas agarici]
MTSLETSLQQYRNTARALFAARPTLSSVVQSLVQAALDQHVPNLRVQGQRILADTLWLGERQLDSSYRYSALSEVLLRRFNEGWSPRYDGPGLLLVSRTPGSSADVPVAAVDLQRLGATINSWGDALLEVFKTRLVTFWNEPVPEWAGKVPGSDAWVPGWDRHSPQIPSRCAALSNLLFVSMYGAGRLPNSQAFQANQLLPKALVSEDQPTRDSLLGKQALVAYLLYARGRREPFGVTPVAVVFARQLSTQTFAYFLLRPGQDVQRLGHIDELWTLLRGQLADPGRLELIPSQLNVFDNLAGALLENQLQSLERLPRGVSDGAGQSWLARIEHVTDPQYWFVMPEPAPLTRLQRRVREAAPLWLLNAADSDRRDYAGLLSTLVTALGKSSSHTLFDDISSLSGFSRQALREAMVRRHPQMPEIRMQDIQLRLEKYRRKPMLPDVLGEFEEVQLTLPELALENLDDFRFGATRMHIRLADDSPPPDWMTADYLVELVNAVDIGARYPAYLRQRLLADNRYALVRQQRFFRQIRAQLPLTALELKLRGEQGVTERGYRWVKAILAFDAHEREVDGLPIVLRPLAFRASPEASPDKVTGMFLIEPRDFAQGPHVLYRPLFDPPLSEYASRSALLAAIAKPGALQDSVLAWLASHRVAVYANGGFRQPHIGALLPGDEAAPLPALPAPATLGCEEVTEGYIHHLFHACINAVIQQADIQLLSNAEKRWARLKDSGWQLFSSWLMFASGPLTQAGWLILLYRGVRQDLPGLLGDDEEARAQAWADMLSNLAALLLHEVIAGGREAPPERADKRVLLVTEGEVRLERITSPLTADDWPQMPFDLSWSNPRRALSAASRLALEKFSVKVFETPVRLESLGAVSASGPNKGLVHLGDARDKGWHVLIENVLYRVAWSDDGPRVVDAMGAPGPFLDRDGQDRWRLDLRLRLRGGSGRETVQARLQRKLRDRATALHGQISQASARIGSLIGEAETLRKRLETMSEGKTAKNFSDRQRSDKRREYLGKLEDLQVVLEEKVGLVKELNDNRQVVPKPQMLVAALADSVRNCRTLLNVSLTVGREGSLSAQEIGEMIAGNTDARYAQVVANLKNNVEITDKQILWSTKEYAALDELRAIPEGGAAQADALQQAVIEPFTPLDWQAVQLPTLLALTLDELPLQITLQLDDQIFAAIKHSAEQTRYVTNTINRLSAEDPRQDRIDALLTAIGRYDETRDLLDYLKTLMPGQRLLEYARRLSELLAQLRDGALSSLSGLWDEAEPVEPEPAPRPGPAVGGRRKKFIRTRNREVYVGRIRERTPEQEDEIVEITDPNGALVSAFKENKEHAGDTFWEEVKPKPAPAPASRRNVGLSRLVTQAQAELDGVKALILQVTALTGTSKDPRDLQGILELKGQTLNTLANDIQQVLNDGSGASASVKTAQALKDSLRQEATRLVAEGRKARIAAIKSNAPRLARLQYLQEQDQVDIHRAGGRQAQRQGGFLQEYVISNKDGSPLWYAHFHYPAATTVDTEFVSAHLKTLAQRYLGRKAQATARQQAAAKIEAGQGGRAQLTLDIHRARILDKGMAQALFFDTDEPDRAG